jgi:transcriptional regulator GlxA family with amidase domain
LADASEPEAPLHPIPTGRALSSPDLHPAKGKNRTRITARLASLLLHSRMHISEVSSETGFTNDAQFCNIFKRETGMSPGAYRKAKADSL